MNRRHGTRSDARQGAAAARGRGGFTLLEIVLVVAVLAIIAGFSWPYLARHFEAAQLPESGEQFRSLLNMTRSAAMLDSRRYRIRFEPDARHPIVEYEADPFLEPGKYEPVHFDWTADERLLGEVHVHEIRPGRPEYTLPYDEEGVLEEEEKEAAETGPEQEFTAGFETRPPLPEEDVAESDAPIDEYRPPIVYQPDGSTDWATIILSIRPPEEPLEQDDPQVWIEIDGRTGLAQVRPALTEEQLADVSWRVTREQLRPPELVWGSELSISQTTAGEEEGAGGLFGGGAGGGKQTTGGQELGDALDKAGDPGDVAGGAMDRLGRGGGRGRGDGGRAQSEGRGRDEGRKPPPDRDEPTADSPHNAANDDTTKESESPKSDEETPDKKDEPAEPPDDPDADDDTTEPPDNDNTAPEEPEEQDEDDNGNDNEDDPR